MADAVAFEALSSLSNDALLAEALKVAAEERQVTARLIALIAEVGVRKLYRQEGYSSLRAYCMRVLGLSEHAAYRRMRAAKVAIRFPTVIDRLAQGTLTLTNARLLAPYLNVENHRRLLDAVVGKSKEDVRALVATLRPRPAGPETVKLELEISKHSWDQLQRLKELLPYQVEPPTPASVLEQAIAFMLAKIEQRKFGKVERPRTSVPCPATANGRYIPSYMRLLVAERDNFCCAFVGRHGKCLSRIGLEFHHLVPFAAGGQTTSDNLELRCRTHNQYEAEVRYGKRRGNSGPRGSARRIGATRSGASAATGKGSAKLARVPKSRGRPSS